MAEVRPTWPRVPAAALAGLAVLAALPILALRFLPLTDFPQHLAVLAMLRHLDDPAYGFAPYYALDLGRTLYLLPYGLGLLFSLALPEQLALQCVVFLSAVAYPLGLMRLLAAMGKPRAIGVLALPLIFNGGFYWGFIHFNLALGLSLWAMALICEERPRWWHDILLAAQGAALVFTHLYGLALLLGCAVLAMAYGPPARRWRRLVPLAPALLGALLWPWPEAGGGSTTWPSLRSRLLALPREALGAYGGHAELPLFLLLLLGVALLAWPRLPGSRARWRALTWQERVAYLVVGGNAALYFLMPRDTPSAMWIHFRHAVIATSLLPLLVPAELPRRARWLAPGGAALLALAGVGNAWAHLLRFDREARGFAEVVAHVPARPRLLSLIFDPRGAVMGGVPYLHFAGYIQARRGGLSGVTFARFWNIPVRLRDDSGVPPLPPDFEWAPRKFDFAGFGHYYGYVLVRGVAPGRRPPVRPFPYRLVLERPPWRLYRRTWGPAAAGPSPPQ